MLHRLTIVTLSLTLVACDALTTQTQTAAGFTATSGPKSGEITLSWEKSDAPASYTIYYKKADTRVSASNYDGVVRNIPSNATKKVIDGLQGQYTFIITSTTNTIIQGTKESVSDPVTAVAFTVNAPVMGGTKAGDALITVDWSKPGGGETPDGYIVYVFNQNTQNSETDSIRRINTSKYSLAINGLTNGSPYFFKVASQIKRNGTTISSALSQLSTQETPTQQTGPLPAPENLRGTRDLQAVTLSWDPVANASGYRIYYGASSATTQTADYSTDLTATTSISIKGLKPKEYHFAVVAYRGVEESQPSDSLQLGPLYLKQVAIGSIHGCALRSDGRLKCWGANWAGRLGTGSESWDEPTAREVSGNHRFTQVSAGNAHSCAIADDGNNTLYCWGHNKYLKLGLADFSKNRRVPTRVRSNVSMVHAGYETSCSVERGTNYCWGLRSYGGLGDGYPENKYGFTDVPQKVGGSQVGSGVAQARQFALGTGVFTASGCAVDRNDAVWCWGDNRNGQVGVGTSVDSYPIPQKVATAGPVDQITGNDKHFCALLQNGTVQCWGRNTSGQVGNGKSYYTVGRHQARPTHVLMGRSNHLKGVTTIDTGWHHTCASMEDGTVRCWGLNANGQLGTAAANAERLVADTSISTETLGGKALRVFAGASYSCALLAGKTTLKCWGLNFMGQLGNGKKGDGATTHVPQTVAGLLN